MKRLILMRHAKAAPPGGGGDFARVLAPRGRVAAPRAGAYLARENMVPERVLVSSAARTRETAALVATTCRLPDAEFEDALYLASAEGILRFIRLTPPRCASLLVIGHNPGLADLSRRLTDPRESDAAVFERARWRFPTSTMAIFDVLTPWSETGDRDCALKTFVTPADLGGVDED